MSETTDTKKFEDDVTQVLDAPNAKNITNVISDAQPLLSAFPEIVKETKEGYKTTEFWATVATAFSVATGLVPTPHDTKGYALVVIVALYVLSRGLAKKGVPAIEPSPVAIAPAATEDDVVAGAPE